MPNLTETKPEAFEANIRIGDEFKTINTMKKKIYKTTLSFRVPIEMDDKLEFISENTGLSKTDLLLEGLKVSLKNHSTIKILEARRDDLTKKIELLKDQ